MPTPFVPRRLVDRYSAQRSELDRVLDTNRLCVVSTIIAGAPWALPMLYARRDDQILIHGSSAAGMLTSLPNTPAVVTVARINGLVLADTLFDSSANYDSAVIKGEFEELSGDSHVAALITLSEALIPGRPSEVAAPTRKQVAATRAYALRITRDNWSVKSRSGGTGQEVTEGNPWQGVIPVVEVWGPPEPTPGCEAPLPDSVLQLCNNQGANTNDRIR